jgi:hypothetical protein
LAIHHAEDLPHHRRVATEMGAGLEVEESQRPRSPQAKTAKVLDAGAVELLNGPPGPSGCLDDSHGAAWHSLRGSRRTGASWTRPVPADGGSGFKLMRERFGPQLGIDAYACQPIIRPGGGVAPLTWKGDLGHLHS